MNWKDTRTKLLALLPDLELPEDWKWGEIDLNGAYLRGTDLEDIIVNWNSHQLVAELLLRQAADDVEKRKIAGLIVISTDWCWEQFLVIEDPLTAWALDMLAPYVKDGDEAPDVLRRRQEVVR